MSGCELRPHHSLCAHFFRGEGYSGAFVENMASVLGALRSQNPLLTLRSSADVICRSCPHSTGGVCDSGQKVARYDAAVLRMTGLADGAVLRWSDLNALTEERILSPGRLEEVCGDCQWFYICGAEHEV